MRPEFTPKTFKISAPVPSKMAETESGPDT